MTHDLIPILPNLRKQEKEEHMEKKQKDTSVLFIFQLPV